MDNLEKFITATNDYYNGRPTGMTDQEYDSLEQELKLEIPGFNKFDYLKIDGPDRTTVRHYLPYTPQLFKKQFFNDEELRSIILDSSSRGKVVTYKMDGCSVTAYYNNGVLIDILTRSDEWTGKRKLDQLKNKFPQNVDPRVTKIDCEAVTSKEDFSEDTRSNSNGLINSVYKQDEVDKYIQLVPFKVTTKEKAGYIEAFHLAGYSDEDIPFVDFDLRFDVRYIPYKGKHYPIDGIVMYDKDDNTTSHEIYKHYANENPTTIVRNIVWNFSDKLAWVPKLQFDTVRIDGRSVSQCSSNGYARLSSIKAGIGAEITIFLANSTIPQVGKVVTPSEDYNLIKTCPFCGNDMILVNDKLRCSNSKCPEIYNALSKGYFYYLTEGNKELWNKILPFKISNLEVLTEVKNMLISEGFEIKKDFWTYLSKSVVLERFGREKELAEYLRIDFEKDPENWSIKNYNDDGLTWNQSVVFDSYKDIYDEIIKCLRS